MIVVALGVATAVAVVVAVAATIQQCGTYIVPGYNEYGPNKCIATNDAPFGVSRKVNQSGVQGRGVKVAANNWLRLPTISL